MKKLIIGLLVLGSVSSHAASVWESNDKETIHIEFRGKTAKKLHEKLQKIAPNSAGDQAKFDTRRNGALTCYANKGIERTFPYVCNINSPANQLGHFNEL